MILRKEHIIYLIMLFYFISLSAFKLGSGFDGIFVRISFIAFLVITLISSKKIIINGQIKWCALFWGWYFLSVMWCKNINDTFYYFNNFIQIIGISISIPLIIKKRKDVDVVLKLLVVSIFITAIVLMLKTPTEAWGTERLGESIGAGPNELGMKMGIGAVISLYLIHNIKDVKYKGFKKVFYLICIILFASVAMFSGSKKAIFILVAGLVGYEVLATNGIKLLLKIGVIGLLLYGVFFLIMNNRDLYSILGRRIEKTVLTITGRASSKDIDTSFTERQFYIEQATNLFKNNILIGYGGNNFVTYMREINYSHVAYSHNNFTELLCTLGIIGFIIYYTMWIYVLISLIYNCFKCKDNQNLLFFLIIFIILMMDYANVSYINEFNILLFVLAYISVKILNKSEVKTVD